MSRTLLLVTPSFIARGDFDAQGRLAAVAQSVPHANVTDAASLTLAALALLKAAPRRVWVLTTAAVTAVIETTPGRLQGLDEGELASALAYEAEALTGLPAMSSQTSARHLPSEHAGSESWWVTQISQRVRGEIESEITQRRARLEGIAHPGGLLPQGTGREGLELWHDLLFMHRPAGFDILPVDESASLEALMSRFPPASNQQQRWILTTMHAMALTDVECHSLHDDTMLRGWLVAAHQILTAQTPAVPVLLPPVQPMSAVSRAWLSVAAAAGVLMLCAGHWWLAEQRLQSAQAEIKTLTLIAKQRDELQTLSAEMGKVRADLNAARLHQAQALRGFGAMLAAVADLRPEGLLVRALKEPGSASPGGSSLRHHGTEAVISGICLKQALAAEFSNALGSQLAPHGWSVRPARTTARLVGNTPVWDFEIPLRLDGGSKTTSTAQAASQP